MEFLEDHSHLANELQELDDRICICIKEIQIFMDGLCEDNNIKLNKTEDTPLVSFLNQLLGLIHESQGLDEYFLQHLSEFRRQNCLSLCRTPCVPCHCDSDIPLILPDEENSSDSKYTPSNVLWQTLCYHIEQYIIQQLKLLGPSPVIPVYNINRPIFSKYLKDLCNIVVPSRVWELYKRVRKYHLKNYVCNCMPDVNEKIQCFGCFLKLCIQYISEDKELICLGHFHPSVVTWTDLLKIYLDVVSDNFSNLMNIFDRWIKNHDDFHPLLHCLTNKNSPCHLHSISTDHRKYWKCEQILNFNNFIDSGIKKNSPCSDTCENDIPCCDSKEISYKIRDTYINIVDMLHSFEKQVISICGGRLTDETEFSHHRNEEDSSSGFYFTLPDDSPEQSPIHEATKNFYSLDESLLLFPWDWRVLLADCGILTSLQQMLQDMVQSTVRFYIKKEWDIFSSTSVVSSTTVKSSNTHLLSIMTSVYHIIKELEGFLFLLISAQGALGQFKASFSHTVNTFVVDLVKHINSVVTCISQKASIYSLYIAVNSAVFLRDRLQIYSSLLSKESDEMESPILSICVKTSLLTQNIINNILTYHLKNIQCGVLHDAESHNWEHHKSFFEGERISYSIQMWFLYIKGVHHDTMRQLPSNLAREIYIRILHDSLGYLVARYSRAMPSDVRIPQLRSDIVVILLYMDELLPPACPSMPHLLGNVKIIDEDKCTSLIQAIHNHCCTLLLVLAIVTSPLSIIYKTFKKGFPHYKLSPKKPFTVTKPWLPWIYPALYPQGGKSSLMSNVSVWILVKLCSSWIDPNAVLVIKAFTIHECALAILFMTQAIQISPENEGQKLKLARSLLHSLACCHHQPHSLVNILSPVIQRLNGWKEFDKSLIKVKFIKRPWWYQGLVELFEPIISSIITAVIPSLVGKLKPNLNVKTADAWQQLKSEMMDFIKCGCEFPLNKSTSDDTWVLGTSLIDMMASLAHHLMTLSPCLHTLLATLDHQLSISGSDVTPFHDSLILQVMLSGLYNRLRDHSFLQRTFGETRLDILKGICASLSALLIEDFSVNEKFQNEIMQDYIKEAERYFTQIKNFYCSWVQPHQKYVAQSKNTSEKIEDDCVCISATELASQPQGKDIIEFLHKLLCVNISWIKASLGIPAVFSTDSVLNTISPSPTPCNATLNIASTSDPLKGQDHVQSPEGQHYIANIRSDIVIGLENPSFIQPEEYSSPRETPVCKEDACQEHLDIMLSQLRQNNAECLDNKNSPQLTLDVDQACLLFNEQFNPLDYFNNIGDSKLDQKLIAEFPFAWDSLLLHSPELGLTEMGFHTLLSHRWEMKGNGTLSHDEEKYLHVLKSQYEWYEDTTQS